MIRLRVTDKDFAEEFVMRLRCAALETCEIVVVFEEKNVGG